MDPALDDGTIIEKNKTGFYHGITITCDEGFSLFGSSESYCRPTYYGYNWQPPIGPCVPNQYGKYNWL